jgi:hypothetical protein
MGRQEKQPFLHINRIGYKKGKMKLKLFSAISILCVSAILAATSCQKQPVDPAPVNPGVDRKIQFELYTDQNFSADNKNIIFTLSIRNLPNLILWDTTLAPMKISEIPDLAHKIVVEKTIPGSNTSQLKVGFYYEIENVGDSWYIDSLKTGEALKVVNFNFR